MICTVTANTSLDKTYFLASKMEPGTVMRTERVLDNAGGKGLNAARACKTCGHDVIATGFIGGHTGHLLLELLEQDGVASDFVEVKPETRSCLNIIDTEGVSSEFLAPGEPVTPENIAELDAKLDELLENTTVLTLNGSLPQGMADDAYIALIKKAQNLGIPCILDTSGDRLIKSIAAKPTMVKPNADEIGQILGRKVVSLDEVIVAAQELHDQGIEKVVVSLGKDGAVMACNSGCFYAVGQPIKAVNPVGSGDTMVGAFACAMEEGMADADQLTFAMSCAAANCLSPETGHFNMEDAQKIREGITIQQVG